MWNLSFIPCHRRKDRTIHIKGKPLPLCARCTGIYLCYFLVPFYFLFTPQKNWIWFALLLQIPALIDGGTQLLKLRESNNFLRLVTGISSGLGQVLFIWFFVSILTGKL
jgi:uncharacterized membrane protein